MKNGTWKRCLHKKEAKLARNYHLYTFSMLNLTFNSVNFPLAQKLFAHVIMTCRKGALPIKAST